MADSPCESWVSSTIGFHHNPEREGEMADSPCESWVSSTIGFHHNPEDETLESQTQSTAAGILNQDEEWAKLNVSNKKNKKSQVLLEGYVESADEDDLTRTKSLTDEDLDELKGCLDLGFGFSYDEIPELCNTLPALELCYSMSQKFMDEQQKLPENAEAAATDSFSSVASPIANWRISSPGDRPEDVKARLKFWAQAVACTVKLCS
ncbi:uncharacterized protein LOC121247027 [Juglans microcarpa x Juglans regia]|uniref:uncharacterized protein LOC121247027 n=1 Tax=Juglans microcarpa x Juglans regia TaxID=2249226 RepID=UPI001B7F09A8|nr:uncharacterized protein LOC121247027 [Juglans microcarpa x Juglans regia]